MPTTNATNAAIATCADLLIRPCRRDVAALAPAEAARLLALLPGWRIENGKLCRDFLFRDFYHTMAFVNALAYLSHAEDHHPEMTVTYKNCNVRYDTHSVNGGQGGLSENDFICAARASTLFHANAVRA